MPEYDETERGIIDHFKREYIMLAEEKAEGEIYKLVVEHKYGKNVRDPMLSVNWGKVFEEKQCPACRDKISLKEYGYLCGKCGFMIPLELYNRAAGQYKNKLRMLEEDKVVRNKIRGDAISDYRVKILYTKAVGEAIDELAATERQRRAESKVAGETKRTSSRTEGTDEGT
jgi:hypothetical protein